MSKVGVFVCHCGVNIAGTVDIGRVVEALSRYPGVAHATDYIYMCSEPGQNLIREKIREHKLDRLVVACCTPTLHETTFRGAIASEGINPYQCEIANIREQCSWVHTDEKEATDKAIKIIESMVEKVLLDEALEPISVPVTKRVLVIGGGISGIQAALDAANSGFEVTLVEKSPSIGGHMIQLSETFPTLDCSQCILTPKMVEVSHHPKVKLMTYSEVQEVSGYVGNFTAKILKKSRFVDANKCTLCGDCTDVCPIVVPNEFERGLTDRRAIYIPFPQAIPATFTLDENACAGLVPIACGKCSQVCEPKAIDYDMKPEVIEEQVGAIIVATGYELYPKEKMSEYGYGQYPDVLDGLQFERILSASGPTQGRVLRPSDHKVPKEVVFIQCVGSRDPEQHMPYCSKICCMYTVKHAMLFKHRVPEGQAYVFYIDVRTAGKGYEEFYHRSMEEDGVIYLRGKVSKVFAEDGKLVVWGVDTLSAKDVEIRADLVVLATAVRPADKIDQVLRVLKISANEHGFLSEAHPKLRPVESVTPGMFLAGCSQGPKDIPEAVAQASAAASKAVALLSGDKLYHDPLVVYVDEDRCSGCKLCISVCPYDAREFDEAEGVVRVNEVLCEGCGACAAACPSGATQQRNFADDQILAMVGAMLRE